MANKRSSKLIYNNKKAYHDYFILEIYQAGISLKGTEVKSLRENRCNLSDSYIKIENNQAIIKGFHISPYKHGNIFNHDPLRDKTLLLHKYEIKKLIGATTVAGHTLIATKIYFNNGYVKLDIAVAKGKKLYDKRQDIAKKDQKRAAEKDFKLKLRT